MYNYVIFGSNWDLYRVSYSDLDGLANVKYISTPYEFRSPVLKFLYRLHWSPTISRFINLPFKSIWNSGYFKNGFQDEIPICFIFFSPYCVYEKEGLVKYLRKKYPGAKMVCFFQDLLVLKKDLNINHIKNVFDLVISFDQAECKEHGLEYHQLVYSNFPVKESPEIPQSDVYFLGKAKNRLDEILKTYEHLKSKNLKCDFHLVGVNRENQVYPDEINYIQHMSYVENLQHIVATRWILEIMQQNGTGYTQRMCEAIAYNKKLLTNNMRITSAPFFKPQFISVFSDPCDIDALLLTDITGDVVDYAFKDQLSPKVFLLFIERKFAEKFNHEN